MGYFRGTVKGVAWVGAFRVSTRFVSFLRTVVLARILTPTQFGVFGIASLAITFLEILMETGINVVLIQKKEGVEKYLNTAWVVSIVRGAIISIVLVAAAPAISGFFNSPESRDLVYMISLVSLIRGFINPAIVRFQKDLRFGAEFWFKFTVFVFDSTVAVAVSFLTRSATGIVWGLVAGAILELCLSFVFVHPRPRFEFDSSKLKEVFSKGKWVTGAGIFQFLFRQGDDAVVGRMLGESSLGIYQVAYKVCSMPISEVTDVVNRVVFPVYAKIGEDKGRLRMAFLKTTTVAGCAALMLGGFLFVFGERMVLFLLGDAWMSAVPLVKVLSVFGVVQAFVGSGNSLFLATEKQAYVTLITFVSIAGLGVSIIPLTLAYGLPGAALAPLVGAAMGLPVMVFLVKKSLDKDD